MAGLARGSWPARALALAAALAPLVAFAAQPPAAAPLRVMALGDAVTVGKGSSTGAGYRSTFWTQMRDAGVEVDMVGGKEDGPDTFDNRHQGYEKTSLHELSAAVHDKMRTYQPDVVLLLTGADEARSESFSPHAFAANLGVMIDRIFTAKHDAKLLISTVPPNKFARKQGAKRALNELLRRTVRERAARGEAVYLVDSFAVLDPQRDMSDGQYPNDAGYERIGEAFAQELLGLLGAEKVE
jgi:lysophospholipase L1-like esterase